MPIQTIAATVPMDEAAPASSMGIAVDGYHVVRNIFSRREIQELRELLYRHFRSGGTCRHGGKIEWRGIHKIPDVARIVINDRLIQSLRDCMSPDAPLLTGESDLQLNTLSRWHKDIDDQGALKDLARPEGDWRVCKAAIYLQDQPAGSPQALKVRPGSHRCRLGEIGEEVALGVQAGDVVLFDVRIDHVGQLPSFWDKSLRRLLVFTNRFLGGDSERQFASLRAALRPRSGGRSDRMALYLTFGRPNEATYAYEMAGRRNHGPLTVDLDDTVKTKLALWNIETIEDEMTQQVMK